jgi:2-amino-4-hydroxy-6-hydroxymethyldihydropteridine diphosphokinase
VSVPEWAFIGLGSNLGDRRAALRQARSEIARLPATDFVAETQVEETEPLGPVAQGRYLNQMVLVRTSLVPRELLDELLSIEHRMGRIRGEKWGPRVIDLDIVRYGKTQVAEPGLSLPHPELPNRAFWQRELTELLAHVAA